MEKFKSQNEQLLILETQAQFDEEKEMRRKARNKRKALRKKLKKK